MGVFILKISVNYDLMEKATLAKKGYSLKRYAKQVSGSVAFCSAIEFPFALITEDLAFFIFGFFYGALTYSIFWYVLDKINKDKEMVSSINELHNLAQKLQDIYVDTDFKMLMDAKLYKTKYSINFDSSLPRIEQKNI